MSSPSPHPFHPPKSRKKRSLPPHEPKNKEENGLPSMVEDFNSLTKLLFSLKSSMTQLSHKISMFLNGFWVFFVRADPTSKMGLFWSNVN
jgi:hypothetical protein